MIKNTILVIAILILVQGLTAQNDTMPMREEIRKLEMAHAAAIFGGDAEALNIIMDDDVTVYHPTNRIVKEKKELPDLIQQGVIRYTSFEHYPETFIFCNNMVVVMGGEIVVPAPGAPNEGKSLKRRYTNVWMYSNGAWRFTVCHANNECPESSEKP